MPPKPDLSFSSLEEFTSEPIVIKPIVEKSEAKASEAKPKAVRKNNGAPIIEDWVSDSEEENVSQTKIENKIAKPSFVKIDFVKVKQTNKTDRKTAKQVDCKKVNQKQFQNIKPIWDNAQKVNHQNFAKKTHPYAKKNMVPRVVLMKSGLVSVNTGRQVNAAHSKTTVDAARPMSYPSKTAHSTVKRPIHKNTTFKNSNFNQKGNPQQDLQEKGDSEEKDVPQAKIEKKAVKPSFSKIEFVKSKEKVKFPRKTSVKQDDYSRCSWVFFLATKDDTSGILKSFITRVENLIDQRVKVIRCDNGTDFKNKEMNQFCERKCIKREFSIARTPQQNGVAERKNRTLIEAARTMLADSKLPTTFWAEAVNTACYVQNRADEGFFVGYSINSKAFRVFNSRTMIVEENLHVQFSTKACDDAGDNEKYVTKEPGKEGGDSHKDSESNVNNTNNVNVASELMLMDVRVLFFMVKMKRKSIVVKPPDLWKKIQTSLNRRYTKSHYALSFGAKMNAYEVSDELYGLNSHSSKDCKGKAERSNDIGSLLYLTSSIPDLWFDLLIGVIDQFWATVKERRGKEGGREKGKKTINGKYSLQSRSRWKEITLLSRFAKTTAWNEFSSTRHLQSIVSYKPEVQLFKEDAFKQGRKTDDIDKYAEITLIDETQGRKLVLLDQLLLLVKVVTTASPTETKIVDDLTLAKTLIELRSLCFVPLDLYVLWDLWLLEIINQGHNLLFHHLVNLAHLVELVTSGDMLNLPFLRVNVYGDVVAYESVSQLEPGLAILSVDIPG
ncbi:putative ribonuclease H-like domain-containing protein [Tanacetum coccineum]